MKNTPCCHDVKACAASMWQKAKRPTVRQTLRYDFCLYPDELTTDRNAVKFHLGGTHSCPLWKLLLVASVALITLILTWKCRRNHE